MKVFGREKACIRSIHLDDPYALFNFCAAHLPVIAEQSDVWDLKAVYSKSEKTAQTFIEAAQQTFTTTGLKIDVFHDEVPAQGIDALLSRHDITAVIVALPIMLQADVVRKAWAAGKHVLSEKPVAADFASAKKLVEEYEAEFGESSWVHSCR